LEKRGGLVWLKKGEGEKGEEEEDDIDFEK